MSLKNLDLQKIIKLANEMEYNKAETKGVRQLNDYQAEVTYEWEGKDGTCEINLLPDDTEESLARQIRLAIDKATGVVEVQDVG